MYKTVTNQERKKIGLGALYLDCFFCAYIHVSQGFALPGLFWLLECADSVKTHPITINTI